MPHGIATSGRRPEIDASFEALGVGPETVVVERGLVQRAKPEPDLFLACAGQLGAAAEEFYAVGDASGTCSPPGGRACSASASSAAATGKTS
ncbi:MAG: HAD hydrolase-like protein [Gaiellaceae bacterium]